MRVAVDATPLLGSRTGVATFTGGLIRALAQIDDVELSAFALSLRGFRRLPHVVPAGVSCVLVPLPAAVLTRLWERVDWPRGDSIAARSADVVHGTNYVVPPTGSAGAVVTVYDLTAVRFPEMVEPASRRYPSLIRAAVRRGALVHVTAQAIADEVRELLEVPEDRICVVPSGIDVPTVRGDAARGHRLAGSKRYVLALGTVEPRKGLPDLVAAFDALAATADHRDLRLVVAGPDGWGVDEFVSAVDRAAHRRRIRRLGWVSDGDRADLLAGATVVAVPSRYEGFGYPPLEAMAVGTPVVATRTGSLPEVLGDAARLVAPRDVDALAAAIGEVVDDAALRDDLASAGPVRAATFTWARCAEGMVEAYHRSVRA